MIGLRHMKEQYQASELAESFSTLVAEDPRSFFSSSYSIVPWSINLFCSLPNLPTLILLLQITVALQSIPSTAGARTSLVSKTLRVYQRLS